MCVGTPLGEVYLDFRANMSGVNLRGREVLIFQAFKRSVALCRSTLRTNLDYVLDKKTYAVKIFDARELTDTFILLVNGVEYNVELDAPGCDEEAALNVVMNAVKPDYPLSYLAGGCLFIESESEVEVEIVGAGSYAAVSHPTYDGHFCAKLIQSEISLIATGMTMEWFNMQHSKLLLERANMGTKHFDKDPDRKKQYDAVIARSNYWNAEFAKRRDEFSRFGY